jgi:hypothetical protein
VSDDGRTPVPYVFDLRFPWDERECVRAELAVARYREGYRVFQWIIGGASVVLAIVSVALVIDDGLSVLALLEALPYIAGCVLFPWLLWRGLPRMLAARNRKPARWSPGQRFAVSEDDLVVELPGDAALIPWRAVGKVVETDEFLFFVGREGLPVYVPKRAFRDEAQLAALRAFVRSHVAPKAALQWTVRPASLPGGGASGAEPGVARD